MRLPVRLIRTRTRLACLRQAACRGRAASRHPPCRNTMHGGCHCAPCTPSGVARSRPSPQASPPHPPRLPPFTRKRKGFIGGGLQRGEIGLLRGPPSPRFARHCLKPFPRVRLRSPASRVLPCRTTAGKVVVPSSGNFSLSKTCAGWRCPCRVSLGHPAQSHRPTPDPFRTGARGSLFEFFTAPLHRGPGKIVL